MAKVVGPHSGHMLFLGGEDGDGGDTLSLPTLAPRVAK